MNLLKLQELLGRTQTQWIVGRLRERIEWGRPLTGPIRLSNANESERMAVGRIFGRVPRSDTSVTVDLGKLEQILRSAEICANLAEAVEALVGPVQNLKAMEAAKQTAWAALFDSARVRIESRTTLITWIDSIQANGTLKRMAESDPKKAESLLMTALNIIDRLPQTEGISLATLAARTTGDSHALDPDTQLNTLVLGAAASLMGIEDPGTETHHQRDLWFSVGVVCDELGSTVLTLNLPGDAQSVVGGTLRLHRIAGEPCRLTLRQLLRAQPRFDAQELGGHVYICENRTVVSEIANQLGARSAPLICTDGQPSTAVRWLLSQITATGVMLHYHGDFDWGGIRIANLIMKRHKAVPWRYSREDYLTVEIPQRSFKGQPVAATWDENLMPEMIRRNLVVEEEHVIGPMLDDLAR